MSSSTRSSIRDIFILGVSAAAVAYGAIYWAASMAEEDAARSLKARAAALALSAAPLLNAQTHQLIADDGLLAYSTQWKALRQLAFAQGGPGGQKGTDIATLRSDAKGTFFYVFAPENQRFKKVERLSAVAKRCAQSQHLEVGEISGDADFLEAAAPLLDQAGKPAGMVVVRMDAAALKTLKASLEELELPFAAGAFILMMLLSLLFRPRHSMDLARLEDELEHLAQSDGLHGRLENTAQGGTKGLAKQFNAILDKVQLMVSSVRKGADLVSGSSQRVSLTATEVSRMANEVATTIQQVAKGTEDQSSRTSELHTIIQAISESSVSNRRKAEETNAASQGASEIAETIHDLAQDAVNQMEKLSKEIRSTAEVIYTLGDKSEKIGEVVDIIRSIADQTNLLALNAAIEAARAGDAGRGFAVVADEVRKLAEGSATSADQIAAMIGEIQGSTKDAVASMQRGSEGVSEGSEVISRVGSGLTQIIEAVRRTSQLAGDISSSAREQTSRSSAGAQRIEEINAIAEQTAASTQEVAASTEEATASMEELTATSAQLAEMARELQGMVSKYDSRN
jgi:methyl-accepting chemotaxis protein